MPDIGATLRETRMRQRIDITEMEIQTKIRAKYLRALENEEWDLLPGPTYVKSFLRTYSDALGLDAKLLVEEYKLRHDTLETGELQPIRRSAGRDRQRGAESRGIPRGVLLALVLFAVLGALFLIGRGGSEDDPGNPSRLSDMPGAQTDGEAATETQPSSGDEPDSRPQSVRLTVQPTASVWVCLENAAGRALIPGETIAPGVRRFRSRRFRITLGNSNVMLRAGDRRIAVPDLPGPIGLAIDARGRSRALSADDRPTCQ